MKRIFFFLLLAFFTQLTFGQESRTISGVVTDADDGSPLIGVSVAVQGTTTGTMTDYDGRFTLSVPEGKSLVFNYVAYRQQVVAVRSGAPLDVALSVDAKMLDEVVAIGYGTMRKSDLTGAVGSVSGEKLRAAPVPKVDQALQGRLAGVTVNANSGQPGKDATVRVRGIGTLNGSDPIYVVDGLITDNIRFLSPSDVESLEVLKDASAQAIYGSRGANGVILITTRKGTAGKSNITFETYVGTQNRWNKLDVMKRDELTNTIAIFTGTKEFTGRDRKTYILGQDGERADGSVYTKGEAFNEWVNTFKNNTMSTLYPAIMTSTNPNGLDVYQFDTDWQDEVFVKDAMIQNYYLSMDGGTDKSSYMISVNHFDQKGTLINSSYKRLTLRVNTSFQIRKWLKVGENLSLASTEDYGIPENDNNTGLLYSALAMAPWDPVIYPEGTLSAGRLPVDLSIRNGNGYSTPTLRSTVEHPYNIAYNEKRNRNSFDLVGDVYVEINPIKELTIRGDVAMKFTNGMSRNFNPDQISTYGAPALPNSVSSDMSRRVNMLYEGTASYRKVFAEKHDLSLMIGATVEDFNSFGVNVWGRDLENKEPRFWYVSSTPNELTYDAAGKANGWTRGGGDSVDKDRMLSFLGRVQYSYDNRYLLTASIRRDGSSRLPVGYFWDTFPSAAVAWKISEEDFFTPLSGTFDFMKIRLGWGRIGNVNSLSMGGNAETLGAPGTFWWGYPFGGGHNIAPGTGVVNIPVQLFWEKSDQIDLGLDFALFNSKLHTTIDIFERNTRDMHMGITPPAHLGFAAPPTGSAATVRNRGIELTLQHQNRVGEFNYNITGNISYIKNKLTALNDGHPIDRDLLMQNEGLPLNTLWLVQYDGVFQNQAEIDAHSWTDPATGISQLIQPDAKPGDARYIDHNNDGIITDDDRINAGNPFPDLTYGLTVGFDWKGIDLQFFFQGTVGNKVYNHIRKAYLENAGTDGVIGTDMRNVFFPVLNDDGEWVNALAENGSNGSIPNPTSTGSTYNALNSTRFVEDASYLRLKDIRLGYTLPKHVTQHIGIERLRFYVSSSNLLTFTKYTGFDPEVGSNGHDWGNYPQSRTILFGLNMNF